MKVAVPHERMAALLEMLHEHDVDLLLLTRTGPGWQVECSTPDPKRVRLALEAAGFAPAPRPT